MGSKKRTKASDCGGILSTTNNHLIDFYRFFTKQILTLRIFYDRTHFHLVVGFLLVAEVILNLSIVNRIKYTEIDWSTYMQQVECFLNGTLKYEDISGDTGPIVYPAGHLYIYTLLYYLTGRGTNIYLAQNFFILLYLSTLYIVFKIYLNFSKVPPYVLMFMCCTSYRIHSIYLLRLFNDPFAMFFLYMAVYLMATKFWNLGCIFYALAVSVKMNTLLFAPGLFLLLIESHSVIEVAKKIVLCAFIEVILGLPFLATYPMSYIKSSFNFGRVFMHKWTVNYRFLPESIFISPYFHVALLLLHLSLLLLFFRQRWIGVIKKFLRNPTESGDPHGENILLTMFTVNFIGIVCARSLHYQFYVWYYHSLPFLLWSTRYDTTSKICILGLIELAWNIYPSAVWSSALLHLLHAIILVAISRPTHLEHPAKQAQ